MTQSLRSGLITVTGLTISAIFAVTGICIHIMAKQISLGDFDQTLLAQARTLAVITEQEDQQLSLDFNIEEMPEFKSAENSAYFAIWRSDGKLIARSQLYPKLFKQPPMSFGANFAPPKYSHYESHQSPETSPPILLKLRVVHWSSLRL